MLIKQGQLKIKNINGKIVARPDLKTAAGNNVVRKHKVGKKGIRYRKVYETKQAQYMYFLEDVANFNVDLTDAAITGTTTAIGGGLGSGHLIGSYLGRNKGHKTQAKYGLVGGLIGAGTVGSLAAYQNIKHQKKEEAKKKEDRRKESQHSFLDILTTFAAEKKKVRQYKVDPETGKKKYLTKEEAAHEKNERAKEELAYKQKRLDQAKAREERLQREDKRRPLDDTRKNVSAAVNVSREAKGWVNTGHKLFGWFG